MESHTEKCIKYRTHLNSDRYYNLKFMRKRFFKHLNFLKANNNLVSVKLIKRWYSFQYTSRISLTFCKRQCLHQPDSFIFNTHTHTHTHIYIYIYMAINKIIILNTLFFFIFVNLQTYTYIDRYIVINKVCRIVGISLFSFHLKLF